MEGSADKVTTPAVPIEHDWLLLCGFHSRELLCQVIQAVSDWVYLFPAGAEGVDRGPRHGAGGAKRAWPAAPERQRWPIWVRR